MNRKNEFTIFFAALVVIGVTVAGGISYFKTQEVSDGLLADIAIPVPPQNPAVETIPVGAIVSTMPSSSTPMAALTLPYSLDASTATSTYWPKYWGDISFINDNLVLAPDLAYHGADSFLNGAASWTNYTASANVSSLMGGWFDVVARVANNTQNFVYCEFGPNGTEVIERVNGADTQLAVTLASTTDNVQGATENFGIEVYGGEIACTMANQEVVGARINDNKESLSGGIGFVIFGAPPEQKQVVVSDIHASALSRDNIILPFPVPVVPALVAVAPSSPLPQTPLPPAPTPPPTVTTATKTLPYFANTFDQSQGWNTYWGNFSVATNSLTMAANTDGTSAGVLLDETSAWDNYSFTATLDWVKGEAFGLYARYTNAQNYVVCLFTEPYLGDVQISLEQYINGNEYTLAQGSLTDYNQWGGSNLTASIEVSDTQGTCSFDNNPVSSVGEGGTLNPPYSGKIGFMTWDPNTGNAQIIVHSLNVTSKS